MGMSLSFFFSRELHEIALNVPWLMEPKKAGDTRTEPSKEGISTERRWLRASDGWTRVRS